MLNKELDQVKSYSTLIVAELHKVVFDENVFERLKGVLRLCEELECKVMGMEARAASKSNVVHLQRIA